MDSRYKQRGDVLIPLQRGVADVNFVQSAVSRTEGMIEL